MEEMFSLSKIKTEKEGLMRRIFTLCILSVFLFGLITSLGLADKEKEVLEKMIKALGGRKLLSGIKDTTFRGTSEDVYGLVSLSVTVHHKEPNKVYMHTETWDLARISAYDGEKVWERDILTGATKELSGGRADEIRRESIGFVSLLNPGKYGITYAYKGEEKVNDNDCIVLEKTFSDGNKVTLYIDAKTYLLYKMREPWINQKGEVIGEDEIYISDYKDIGGIKIAHTEKLFRKGQEFVTTTFTEIKFNTGIDDSLFKMN